MEPTLAWLRRNLAWLLEGLIISVGAPSKDMISKACIPAELLPIISLRTIQRKPDTIWLLVSRGKKMWNPRGGLEWLSEAEGDRRAGTKGGALFPWRRADMCECLLFKRSTQALFSTQDPYVSTHLHFPRHSRFVMLSQEPFLIVVKSSFFMGGGGCEGSVIHFYKIALKFLHERC